MQFAYDDFSSSTNEAAALDKILTDASKKGLTFISDRDARPGGLHPNAHLWDNGKDPVSGLRGCDEGRGKALDDFGQNSILQNRLDGYARRRALCLFIYSIDINWRRPQKVVGGMYYSYAIKGDGQVVTKNGFEKSSKMHSTQLLIVWIQNSWYCLKYSETNSAAACRL